MGEGLSFHGRRFLCFLALPHHNRILLPVMERLRQGGAEILFLTAETENAFEKNMNRAGLSYRTPQDYRRADQDPQVWEAYLEVGRVWQERFLDSRVLQALALPIWDKVLRSVVEEAYLIRNLFEVERPDGVFALHELNRWGKLLGHRCAELGIPFVTFQEGHYYGDTFHYRFHTEYSTACVVWGEETRRLLAQAGNSLDKTLPLGNVDLTVRRQELSRPEALSPVRRQLGLRPGRKVVLFLMGMAHYAAMEPEELLALASEAEVVFKWHPRMGEAQRQVVEERLQGRRHVHSLQHQDVYELMALADVLVLIGRSTTGVEALTFGKPVIEMPFPGEPFMLADQGVVEGVRDLSSLASACRVALSQPLDPERVHRVEAFLDRLYSVRDGSTVERVAAMVARMVEACGRRPSPLPSPGEASFRASVVVAVDRVPLEGMISTLQALVEGGEAGRCELILVDASGEPGRASLLDTLEGDVQVLRAELGESLGDCLNRGAQVARGESLVFLRGGEVPDPGWLNALLEGLEEPGVGAVGGLVRDRNGLIWSLGVAFEGNRSPFPLYRFLPAEFVGARRERDLRALYLPFATPRDLFLEVGGFDPHLRNRLEDVAYGLSLHERGLRCRYRPQATALRAFPSWEPGEAEDLEARIWFYAAWSRSLETDEAEHLAQDGLDGGGLSALYREQARALVARTAGALQGQG